MEGNLQGTALGGQFTASLAYARKENTLVELKKCFLACRRILELGNNTGSAFLIYSKHRVEYLKRVLLVLCNQHSSTVGRSNPPSPEESSDTSNYEDILASYDERFSGSLSIRHHREPPSDLYIQVYVEKDLGWIQTENGPMFLGKNSIQYTRESDVIELLKKGWLRKLF